MGKEMQWTLGLIAVTVGLIRSTLPSDVRPVLADGLSGWGGSELSGWGGSELAGPGESASLADWQGLIDQSPDLQQQVAIALPRLNRRPEHVSCSGVRLGQNLDPLAGYRVTPVDCWFDGWVLHLDAENFAVRDDGTAVPLASLLYRSKDERSEFTGVSFKLKAWRWYPRDRD